MFSGIHFEPVLPSGGSQLQKRTLLSVDHTQREHQHYDQFEFSDRLEEMERKHKELVGQISQKIRIRPTNGQLEELQKQIRAGTYRPDPQEIAARMLLLRREDF